MLGIHDTLVPKPNANMTFMPFLYCFFNVYAICNPRVHNQGCKVVAAARQFTILTLFYAFLYYKIRNFLIYEDILANKVSKCSQEHFLPGYQLILSMEKSLNPTYHV